MIASSFSHHQDSNMVLKIGMSPSPPLFFLKSVLYISTSSFSKRSGSQQASALTTSMALRWSPCDVNYWVHTKMTSLRKDSPDGSQLESSVVSSLVFPGMLLCFSAVKGCGPYALCPSRHSVPCSQCGWEQLQTPLQWLCCVPKVQRALALPLFPCDARLIPKGREETGNEGTLLIPRFTGEPRKVLIFHGCALVPSSSSREVRAAAMSLPL